MPTRKAGRTLHDLVAFLYNYDFIVDSNLYWNQYRTQSEKIGQNEEEWNHQTPPFMSKYLDPFIEKWNVYPLFPELLSSWLWQKRYAATMTGRWGIIPVYPWTTEEEVTNQLTTIQLAIGKKHQ